MLSNETLINALEQTGGNITKAAKVAGISRVRVHQRLEEDGELKAALEAILKPTLARYMMRWASVPDTDEVRTRIGEHLEGMTADELSMVAAVAAAMAKVEELANG